ncbi:MAG: FadR family transcriptional regulator [Firmicutes bacterium]|nr:FadR family transcriptional regulator [Bacillota bacterium]
MANDKLVLYQLGRVKEEIKMHTMFTELKSESLKELFVKEVESKIISGQIKPGDRLPPERELANLMGVSRSIVNSGILELASKGFVRIIPRKGTVVEDYKNEGTPSILVSIMNYNEGKLSPRLFNSMMDTRLLIEVESARCAAINRGKEDLQFMESLISGAEKSKDLEEHVKYNYNFHHRVIIASGNVVYAMIFKSFEPVCLNLIRTYFEAGGHMDKSVFSHKKLFGAIKRREKENAGEIMKEILQVGRRKLVHLAVTD